MVESTQNSQVPADGLNSHPRRRTVPLVAMIWAVVATLVLGTGATVSVFAATKRADELERAGALGTAIGQSYSDAEDYVQGCRDDIDALVDDLQSAQDSYESARGSVDEFLTSGDYLAGDVSTLYNDLGGVDADMSGLSSIDTLGECDPAAFSLTN